VLAGKFGHVQFLSLSWDTVCLFSVDCHYFGSGVEYHSSYHRGVQSLAPPPICHAFGIHSSTSSRSSFGFSKACEHCQSHVSPERKALSNLPQSGHLCRDACSERDSPEFPPSYQARGTALSGRKNIREACRGRVLEVW